MSMSAYSLYGLKKKSSAFPFLARNLKSRKIILVQGHTVKTVPVLEEFSFELFVPLISVYPVSFRAGCPKETEPILS